MHAHSVTSLNSSVSYILIQPSVEIAELIYNCYKKYGHITSQFIEKQRLNQRLRVVQDMEDSARKNVVKSLMMETEFEKKELEDLYVLFKVSGSQYDSD